ncbi:hypothetical protein K457DRAFT_126674 [Linnemannia elongata AG-77]|uniref:Uncharacterized protein n=1 Tax=Linnemannia elongata AG-77 TaxID=1314771 RepID=A0A197JW32_9FUNG|nr:hypothetical protein K457DRAFT_126674 [Linnemannia elongata AG-77]
MTNRSEQISGALGGLCRRDKSFVCKDKVVVAAKHTPDIAAYLDDTEEADDMYYDNPSEGIDAASNTNAVEGVHQAANRGALDDVDIAAPGYGCGRESGPTFGMDLRLNSPKWLLESGAVVKDVLLQAGLGLSVDHSICSFMVDLKNKYTESLFSSQNWTEIITNLPASATSST